ncbi:unnamed protein product [Penicillium salamii]|uniref:DUF6536 domain-containing protein n=1 Tax=Penicillium salamii TaxID=1612424 RepID=A0A9W4IL93_9EURO|nr:unnamed protein product [Penicillium salamii]
MTFCEAIEPSLSDEHFIQDDAESKNSSKESSWDWRSNVKLALSISIITLIANFILLVVGITVRGQDGGIGTLHEGRAKKIARITTAYHVLINILSTGLLTSSNYCMQLVCAPTRDDMNRLHARGNFFDIGILSFRNVRHIPRRRAILWIILATSSIPLHLLYNSSIFSVTVGRDYDIGFINDSNVSAVEGYNANHERLENSVWMDKYDTKYSTEYGNLYLVLDHVSFELEFSLSNLTWQLQKPTGGTSFSWKTIDFPSNDTTELDLDVTISLNQTDKMSGGIRNSISTTKRRQFPIANYSSQTMPSIEWPAPFNFRVSSDNSWKDILSLNPDAWMDPPWHVGYGFAEVLHKGSAVQISSAFLAVVLACNLLKTLAIYYILRGSYDSQIITQGDAISSFLADPDHHTVGFCAIEKSRLIKLLRSRSDKHPEAEVWENRKSLYLDRAIGRWASYMTLGFIIAMATVGVIFFGIQRPSEWGTASKQQIQVFASPLDARNILLTSWLANSPQLLLSIFYLAANRICTSLCFAREWNDHALHRKALRVTRPQGNEQRSTYFLQLPYRWAVPLTIMSGLLHWLLSQALFLVRVETYDTDKKLQSDASTCACGYSKLSLLVFLICLLVVVASILVLMSRSITYSIPPAHHCSLSISAACHPPPALTECHLKPVKWGVVPNLFGGTVDHCSFSSEEVQAPQEGSLYA